MITLYNVFTVSKQFITISYKGNLTFVFLILRTIREYRYFKLHIH